ncbi:MOSC N-terminal beta barrel domain-containing protein [Haladaptatus sp. SPP-AMP-3]|uniref:MOSC domain-containing protein n=1 Tax=Haladaptatus sp. SPP-AMP-3 TaxID=3121295 RepID=UPI003C2D4A6A
MSDTSFPHLTRIAVHPIKSLEPVTLQTAEIGENGGLQHDREYAMFDDDEKYVNGKRTADVHRIRASFDDAIQHVTLRQEGKSEESARRFNLSDDWAELADWLTEYFGYPVHLKRESKGGFPDDTVLSGPTVISTATLREVASWFDGLDEHQMRLRLRANLEIGGVPPFWEDRLYSDHDHGVAFRIGDVTFRGANPCQRCIVPVRDPHTGEEYSEFQRLFIENRERTLPEWADRARFDHYFRLMVNTKVPESEWKSEVAVGDELEILGKVPLDGPVDEARSDRPG